MGIEPTTATLGKWSSTTELRPHLASNPAGETLEKPGETPRGRSAWEAGTLPLRHARPPRHSSALCIKGHTPPTRRPLPGCAAALGVYNADMTTKDDLHRIIDRLTEEEADQLLDSINLKADPDELTPEEAADVARIRAEADYVPLKSLRRELGLPPAK